MALLLVPVVLVLVSSPLRSSRPSARTTRTRHDRAALLAARRAAAGRGGAVHRRAARPGAYGRAGRAPGRHVRPGPGQCGRAARPGRDRRRRLGGAAVHDRHRPAVRAQPSHRRSPAARRRDGGVRHRARARRAARAPRRGGEALPAGLRHGPGPPGPRVCTARHDGDRDPGGRHPVLAAPGAPRAAELRPGEDAPGAGTGARPPEERAVTTLWLLLGMVCGLFWVPLVHVGRISPPPTGCPGTSWCGRCPRSRSGPDCCCSSCTVRPSPCCVRGAELLAATRSR